MLTNLMQQQISKELNTLDSEILHARLDATHLLLFLVIDKK